MNTNQAINFFKKQNLKFKLFELNLLLPILKSISPEF